MVVVRCFDLGIYDRGFQGVDDEGFAGVVRCYFWLRVIQ